MTREHVGWLRCAANQAGHAREPSEANHRQAANHGQQADAQQCDQTARAESLVPHLIRLRYKSHLLTNPFSGGKAAIATAPNIMAFPVQGIRFIRPPSFSMSRVAGPVQDAAGGEEHQPFHEGVIPDVEQAGRHSEDCDCRVVTGRSPQSHAEGQGDQADVLDAGIGERSLHIALIQRQ